LPFTVFSTFNINDHVLGLCPLTLWLSVLKLQ